jgi:glycosyltransferase involved in cell wall biosynthesis
MVDIKGKICFMTCAQRTDQLVVQRRQAKCLQQQGYALFFIVADNYPIEEIDGIAYYPAGSVKGNYFKRFIQLSKEVERVAREIDADIYQTETPDLLSVCVKMKKRGKKVFFNMLEGHPYTLYNKLHFPKYISAFFVEMMAFRMKYQLRKLDYVFGVSDDIMRYLDEWGIEKKVLLGNYPEVNRDYVLTHEEYMAREPRAIYYGHIPCESNQELIFDALSNIPGLHYMLAGKFWNKSYEESVSSHPYWSKVEFIDGFERKELPKILSRCTISNVARDLSKTKSSNGSLGIIKIFESMEAALPLILPDLPIYRDMISKYNCGVLVDINDSLSIEKGFRTLLEDKDKAYNMGQNGRRAVIEEYSWDIVSKLYIKILTA